MRMLLGRFFGVWGEEEIDGGGGGGKRSDG